MCIANKLLGMLMHRWSDHILRNITLEWLHNKPNEMTFPPLAVYTWFINMVCLKSAKTANLRNRKNPSKDLRC